MNHSFNTDVSLVSHVTSHHSDVVGFGTALRSVLLIVCHLFAASVGNKRQKDVMVCAAGQKHKPSVRVGRSVLLFVVVDVLQSLVNQTVQQLHLQTDDQGHFESVRLHTGFIWTVPSGTFLL